MKQKLASAHLTQAHLIALATAVISQVVAYVPAWAPEKQKLIATAGLVIAAAFLISEAIRSVVGVVRDLLADKVSGPEVLTSVEALVKAELGKVDFDSLAKDALSGGNAAALVQSELRKVLSSGLTPAPVVAPVPDPVTPEAPTPPTV